MTQLIVIQRNETARWVPWPKGYLNVQSDPPAATVVVDGTERGAAPLVVEVDPGVLHSVELRMAKYEPYRADLSAAAARKVSFQPILDPKKGSIRVVTTPPGAQVQLDGGEFLETPCTYESVTAGLHGLKVADVLVNRRYFTSAKDFTVEVNPDEQTVLSQEMVRRDGNAPDKGSAGGEHGDDRRRAPQLAARIRRRGRCPGGNFDVVVTSPSKQVWRKTIWLSAGKAANESLDGMDASLPLRTINVDGKGDDWNGIEPLWGGVKEKGGSYDFHGTPSGQDPFPKQTGTVLVNASLCRDEANIYVKMDFYDGKPSLDLTSDVKGTLTREVQCFLPDGKILILQVASNRQWGVWAGMTIWDSSTRTSTHVGELSKYAMGDLTLEMAIPWSRVQKYLSAGPVSAYVDVVDAGEGSWNKGYATYRRSVDFLK